MAYQALARDKREHAKEQNVNTAAKYPVYREQSVNTAPFSLKQPLNTVAVEAVSWLRERLTTPQHIAPVIAEWVGTMDNPTGRDVDDLMSARWTLRVDAYVGEDERLWWRLPGAWSLWACEHCGESAAIEDVTPSSDGTRTLTFWRCEPCQMWGVTPATLHEPLVWVSRTVQ